MLSYANLHDVSDGKLPRLTKLTFSLCNYEVRRRMAGTHLLHPRQTVSHPASVQE